MRMAALHKGSVGALAAAVLICLPAAAHQRTIEVSADGEHPASLGTGGYIQHSTSFDAGRFEGRPGSAAIRLVEGPSERSFSVSSPPLRQTAHAPSALVIQSPQPSDPATVHIPSASLRALLERTLGKLPGEPIYRHEMAALTALDAHRTMRDEQGERIDFGGFRNLAGLQHAVNLTFLDLDARWWDGERWVNLNAIEDLAPLAGLTKLTHLGLSGGAIWDVSPLANLKRLETLLLWNNEITDLTPLAGLTNVTELNISSNDRLSDISPLSNLPLERLSAHHNDIFDISPLAAVTTLERLAISTNYAYDEHGNVLYPDVSVLASLVNLRNVGIGFLRATDISALENLHDLRNLYAPGNKIGDISTLAAHPRLQTVWLNRNNITDISALAGLVNLENVFLGHNEVIDASALKGLVDVRTLGLEHNDIADVSALTNLASLNDLDLRSNRISDISPLVQNAGLDAGDDVDLRLNPIRQTSLDDDIPALKSRGVSVRHSEFVVVRHGDPLKIYNDNVVILPISEDHLASDELRLRECVEDFYAHFKDEFDFLMFLSNLEHTEYRARGYLGRYFGIRNDVHGIGEPIRASERQLQGFMHFSYYFAVANGPTLHELMHRWANEVVVPEFQPHWGLTSADGILGGFDIDHLVDNGDGTYYVTEDFSVAGEALNSKPFSPIELYLAGFVAAESVPDLLVMEGARILYDDEGRVRYTEDGFRLLGADEVASYSIEDLVAEHGWREPSHINAQRDFRAAAILLVDPQRPATKERLDLISANVAWFSNPGWDDASGFNFYEATGGRGTMKMDDLNAASLAPE